jgi:hypothetical protein
MSVWEEVKYKKSRGTREWRERRGRDEEVDCGRRTARKGSTISLWVE